MEKEVKDCKELWWEGNDLHIITKDDQHLIFQGAYFKSMKVENDPNIVKETSFTFTAEEVE